MESGSKVEAAKAITIIDSIKQRVLEVGTGDVCFVDQLLSIGVKPRNRCKAYKRNEYAIITTEKGLTTRFQKYANKNR